MRVICRTVSPIRLGTKNPFPQLCITNNRNITTYGGGNCFSKIASTGIKKVTIFFLNSIFSPSRGCGDCFSPAFVLCFRWIFCPAISNPSSSSFVLSGQQYQSFDLQISQQFYRLHSSLHLVQS